MPTIAGAFGGLLDELTAAVEPLAGGRRQRARFVLVERGDEFECYRVGRRGLVPFTRGSLANLGAERLPRALLSQPVEVRLDGSRMLTKTLKLPAASRNYLDAVVRHQLDRVTPWSADRVVFDYAIAEDEPVADDQIAVRLVATSRDVFDSAIARLAAVGIKPAVVGTSEDPLDRPSAVNLTQANRAARRARLRRNVAAGLLAVVAIGALLSGFSGWRLYQANAESASLGEELAAVRAEIESLRAGTERSETLDQVLAEKQESVPAVLVVDQLSALIPTSTYLTEMSIDGRELRVAGLSSETPALIGILEAADFLDDVRFAAPTTREEGATQERFEIVAQIAPAVALD